jgi:two-component system, NtrC family, response regulator GlrR
LYWRGVIDDRGVGGGFILAQLTIVMNIDVGSGEVGKRRDTILIVDDDRDARELIGQVLVEVAADGFEAMAKLPRALPDLVLTDLRMPGMHGTDLAQRIRLESDVPVVLTTGNETFDLCTSSEAYGAVACLLKPINLDELLWTIDCALACRRAADGTRSLVA